MGDETITIEAILYGQAKEYIYIYICMYRERERERKMCLCLCLCLCLYIYPHKKLLMKQDSQLSKLDKYHGRWNHR